MIFLSISGTPLGEPCRTVRISSVLEFIGMKLLVSGGGTGGHFFPALEVLKRAKERGIESFFVGTERGIERSFEHAIPGGKIFLRTEPFRGVSLSARIRSAMSFLRGVSALWKEVRGEFKSLIFGGYSSVPLGVYTIIKRKELYIHEQNSVPSMTNRLLSAFSRKVFITFEHSRRFFKGENVIRTGLPIREELLSTKLEKENAKEALGFEPGSPLVLFMGGSQGARFINSLAVDFAKRTGAPTLLLSGSSDFERVRELADGIKNLKVFPFRTDMGLIYSASEVAVCRAGAGTVSELSHFRVPALFIPYPYAAGNHQYYNAKEIEELGGAFVLSQEEASLDKVIGLVDRIFGNISSMREAIGGFAEPKAAELIINELFKD
jgi:UDP-N-acetylglucosamine--N-acetylmuramyl-(pentapeptide) pyrophosphoryl-undecaprenol N-acetylglucosamine transferase